jgi:hypothetical protein
VALQRGHLTELALEDGERQGGRKSYLAQGRQP